MNLTVKPISRRSPDYEQFKNIQLSSFDRKELVPMWLLHLMAKSKHANYLGIYDGDEPIAITFTIESTEMVYLLYVAVREDLRNRGYGSEIVRSILKHANGRELSLNAEYPGEDAPDDDIRTRRLRFYERLGIYQSGWGCTSVGISYAVLSTNKELNIEVLNKTVSASLFGLYKVDLYQIKKLKL